MAVSLLEIKIFIQNLLIAHQEHQSSVVVFAGATFSVLQSILHAFSQPYSLLCPSVFPYFGSD